MIGETILHYKILEKLGEGGMGEVYKARDLNLRRIAALKFLPIYFSGDKEAKERFIHEAQTASSLDHPNICTIYEIDEIKNKINKAAGRLFIAMAFYEGETLKRKIQRGALSIGDVVDIAIQIAKGLSKAHQQSIIHRDIKPENVIVTKDGTAKILDFGLARLAGRTKITRPEFTMGTLSYISPEQIRSKKIDHRTDIWSFGVMLYEMLTRELPFKGEIDQAVIYSILNEAPEPLKINIPEQLKKVICMALEKNPSDRYLNMEEVITELCAVGIEKYVRMDKHKTSIAVLPFKNLSEDRNQEYFCDGMAEEIINALAAVRGLRVIARTSSFAFKRKHLDIREIGRKLNVDTILEGSIRKTKSRLRITAQLINVSDGSHIWSEKFDRTMEDILIIQDEISLLLVKKLKIELMEEEKNKIMAHGTDNLEAYNLYLLGKFYASRNSKADIEKGLEYFKKAVEKDNKYLIAYLWLVISYATLIGYYRSVDEKIVTFVKEYIDRIMKIDPDSTPAHLALSSFHMNFTRNWELARIELEKLKEREPNNPVIHHQLSVYYFYIADFENAILEEISAQRNDPLQIECILRLGICYLRARKAEEARRQFSMVIELAPDLYFGYWMLGQTYVLDSDFERGIELLNKALALSNEDEWILADLVRAYALGGNKKAANLVLKNLRRRDEVEHLHPYTFVTPYCALDRLDEAFEWMEKSLKEHDPTYVHLFGAEGLDNLRRDPRFMQIIKKYGLDKYYKTVQ